MFACFTLSLPLLSFPSLHSLKVLIHCRNNHKILARIKAFDRHCNMFTLSCFFPLFFTLFLLKGCSKTWRRCGPSTQSQAKSAAVRFTSPLFSSLACLSMNPHTCSFASLYSRWTRIDTFPRCFCEATMSFLCWRFRHPPTLYGRLPPLYTYTKPLLLSMYSPYRTLTKHL